MVFSEQFWRFQRGDSREQLTSPSARFLQQVYTFSFITLSHCCCHFVIEVKLTWKIESRSIVLHLKKYAYGEAQTKQSISYKQLKEVCTTKKGLSSQSLIPSVRTCVCQYCTVYVLSVVYYNAHLQKSHQYVLSVFSLIVCAVCIVFVRRYILACILFFSSLICLCLFVFCDNAYLIYVHKSSRPFLINSVSIIQGWVVCSSFCTPSVTYLT